MIALYVFLLLLFVVALPAAIFLLIYLAMTLEPEEPSTRKSTDKHGP
jgi:hypothetical protein